MRFRQGYIYQYQATAFRVLLIICIVSSASFLIVNFCRGLLLLAFFQTLFAGGSGLVLLLLLKGKFDESLYKVCCIYLLILYSLLCVGLLLIPNIKMMIFSVIFLVPPVSYLLLGRSFGFFYTALFSSAMLFLYLFRLVSELGSVSMGAFGNLVACLATVWLFSSLYEKSRQKSQELLIKTTSEDSLTQLLSRSCLDVVLGRDLQSSIYQDKPLSIVIIDIDWFQIINDNYGHDLGDKVLVEVAQILKKSIRHSDSAFRLEGQEFCLSLPNTTPREAYNVTEKIRTTIEQSVFQFGNTVISLTISAGVVGCYDKNCLLDQSLRQAHKSVYLAKKAGRNQVVMNDD